MPFKTLRVERQRLQSGEIGPPKSRRSRNVPVGEVVLDAVRDHVARYSSDEWLFTDEQGDPLTYPKWQKGWRKARREAGCPDMVTHDTRHFYASTLIAGGASVKMVQTALGHSSAMITLRVYAHLFEGDEDRTRGIVDGTLKILRTQWGLDGVPNGSVAGQRA